MNLSQKLAETRQSLASLDERIYHAELRRDHPPLGHLCLDSFHSTAKEELRVLYIGRAQLLQLIQRLENQLESKFAETFWSVLEAARTADAPAAKES